MSGKMWMVFDKSGRAVRASIAPTKPLAIERALEEYGSHYLWAQMQEWGYAVRRVQWNAPPRAADEEG